VNVLFGHCTESFSKDQAKGIMAEVQLRILENAEACAEQRCSDMEGILLENPAPCLLMNTGRTPVRMYERFGEAGLDLSMARIRMLDAYLLSPSRGFETLEHHGSFLSFLRNKILSNLTQEHRPRDFSILPGDIASCEEVEAALHSQEGHWHRPPHPVTEEPGSEIVLHEDAEGPLARVQRACTAYDRLLNEDPPRVASLGIGPMPYPHMAFNNAPYTRPEAPTHLSLMDEAVRISNKGDFGAADRVPTFALTTGPATILLAEEIWITATGPSKSLPIAWSFGDPGVPDFFTRSSIGYALLGKRVSLLLDQAAAKGLLADGGLQGLKARYKAAGHRMK
jgi:6-phosphogluconolactonase/glucosamine-6-phosphate isomerase/deaminase